MFSENGSSFKDKHVCHMIIEKGIAFVFISSDHVKASVYAMITYASEEKCYENCSLLALHKNYRTYTT